MKKCMICGEELKNTKIKNQKFCSNKACSSKFYYIKRLHPDWSDQHIADEIKVKAEARQKAKEPKVNNGHCLHCGESLGGKRQGAKFCNQSCNSKYWMKQSRTKQAEEKKQKQAQAQTTKKRKEALNVKSRT